MDNFEIAQKIDKLNERLGDNTETIRTIASILSRVQKQCENISKEIDELVDELDKEE